MKELTNYLSQFLTENRKELMDEVIQHRTNYISVVLEDIYQSQNASAVLRTCDCFGIQQVNVIENRNEFTLNSHVTLGASKWLTINKYNQSHQNTIDAIRHLKEKGYRIVATTPHADDVNLEDFNIEDGKFALVFGTEKEGISDAVREHADEFLKIPMYGFTESFNLSVSAAIVLHHLAHKLRNSGIDWKLSEDDKNELLFQWYQKSIKKSASIIQNYLDKNE